MEHVGIEAMNLFGGTAVLNLEDLAVHRQLDRARFENLLMKEKTVALPCEDPVTFGVNAAQPIIAAMTPSERNRIALLITCTESGVDFGKSMSTYIHQYLGLSRNCRLFEIKQACYSGTAGLQMAVNFILSKTAPREKALVVTTDISRFVSAENESATQDWSFAEPSGGAGAVAMLISAQPHVLQMDVGASGYYGYEVMDTCRPTVDGDAGDADLSLLSYLDCCEAAYKNYVARVVAVDYRTSFDYLVFHTPFGGMVKGAHRTMMRKMAQAKPADIEVDFQQRVVPGLGYCQRVGNIMGGTLYMALASTLDHTRAEVPQRLGCFSYGSGCCSEFFSGVVTPESRIRLRRMDIQERLDNRHRLSMDEYDSVLRDGAIVRFGTRNAVVDGSFAVSPKHSGEKRLYLREIRDYHRKYEWQ